MLERLDLSSTFTAEYYQDNFDYYSDGDSTGGGKALPYDEPLRKCVNSLEHLKRLDIGHGDQESQHYMFDYMLSPNTVMELDVATTMKDYNVSEDWSSVEKYNKARSRAALKEIYEDENEDGDVRDMASREAGVTGVGI